jgi:hypothetical protein
LRKNKNKSLKFEVISMNELEKIKFLYEDGYRCIYTDDATNHHEIYLKNFETEKSEVIKVSSELDYDKFKNYIESLRTS